MRLIVYIENILTLAGFRKLAREHVIGLIYLLENLGSVISKPKSALKSTQATEFLGFSVKLCQMEEHQHQLAHQSSPNIIGIWEWGICGLMGGAFMAYWVGHL